MSAAIHTDMNDMLPEAPVSRLEARVAAANAAGRPALVPFLTAGFPTLDRFWEEMDGLDRGGADVIEIGVPFSDRWPTARWWRRHPCGRWKTA